MSDLRMLVEIYLYGLFCAALGWLMAWVVYR